MTKNGIRTICGCGFPVVRYPGAYPKNCPLCGEPLGGGSQEAPADPPDDGEDPSADDDNDGEE